MANRTPRSDEATRLSASIREASFGALIDDLALEHLREIARRVGEARRAR